jgi:hypothetical protein
MMRDQHGLEVQGGKDAVGGYDRALEHLVRFQIEMVDEITAGGGEAVANTDDIADWEGARRLVHTAIATFGVVYLAIMTVARVPEAGAFTGRFTRRLARR